MTAEGLSLGSRSTQIQRCTHASTSRFGLSELQAPVRLAAEHRPVKAPGHSYLSLWVSRARQRQRG